VKPATFTDELKRALGRDDIDYLKRCLDVYYSWNQKSGKDKEDDWSDELDIWFTNDDADQGLALVMLAAAQYDDADFLCLVAAGKLEDILCHDPAIRGFRLADEFINRIVTEARRTARFRWMLSGVWTHSMPHDQAKTIREAVGDADCNVQPLPQRPWA
jgi:hypothetical protein